MNIGKEKEEGDEQTQGRRSKWKEHIRTWATALETRARRPAAVIMEDRIIECEEEERR